MKLVSKDGSSFEMIIPRRSSGYGFLRVKCSITNSEGTWTAVGSDFEIHEMKDLADWFERVCRGERRTILGPSDEKIVGFDFLEPWLLFQYTEDESDGDVLRVIIDGEYVGTTPPHNNELWVDFPIGEVDLMGAAETLRKHLEKYFKDYGLY